MKLKLKKLITIDGAKYCSCGLLLYYTPCKKHKSFPIVNKSKITIPDCKDCSLKCPACGNRSIKMEEKNINSVTRGYILHSIVARSKKVKKYQKIMSEILDTILSYDAAQEVAIAETTKLLEMVGGSPVGTTTEKLMGKVSDYLFLLLLIRGVGLGAYEEMIMKEFVQNGLRKRVEKQSS